MNRNLLLLYFALFIAMVGFGITLPALPFFVERLAPTGGLSSRMVALHVGGLTSAYAVTQLVAAPFCGVWSDRHGRKPLVIVGLAGFAVSQAVFGVGTSLPLLYSARLVGGVFSAAILTAASAYVADLLSREKRGRGMAWLGTAQSLGFVIGPIMSALLSRHNWHLDLSARHLVFDGFSIPFFAAAGLALITIPLIVVALPESRGSLSHDGAGPPMRIPWKTLIGHLKPLLVLVLISQGAVALFEAVFALYAARVMSLTLVEIGYGFAICGLVMALFQGGAAGFMSGRIRGKYQVVGGFVMLGTGLVLLLLVRTVTDTYWTVGLLAFGAALITPNLLTSIANRSGSYVGAGLGLRNAFGSLGQIAGPLIGGALFGWQVGLPFLLAGGLVLIVAALIAAQGSKEQNVVAGLDAQPCNEPIQL